MNLDYPLAIQRPGPHHKAWAYVNTIMGVICHSMEGYEEGAWSQLDGDAEVSWHFSIMQDGAVYQHYRLDESPWHAGSKAQNLRLIGIEHEGVKGEPLTPLQLKASVALVRWIAREARWEGLQRGVNLLEHHEVNPATQCPSGRIPWAAYTEEDDVQLRDLDQREEQILGAALPLNAGNWLSGANGNKGAQMVVGSSPRQVLITITDEDWNKAAGA